MLNIKSLALPSFQNLKQDIPASLALVIVAIPLCLGIAHASGAPLLSGLLSGIIGGLIVGYFSESNLSVSGPAAGLTSICLMATLELGSFQGLVTAILFAGLIQVVFGLLRLGFITNYIPSSVIRGMLAAIGLILILKQFPHLIGYDSESMGIEGFDIRKEDLEVLPTANLEEKENTLSHLLHSYRYVNYFVMLIGLISLGALVIWEKFFGKRFKAIPGSLIAVVLATIIAKTIQIVSPEVNLGREHFVNIPELDFTQGMGSILVFPSFQFLSQLLFYKVVITIALVASLESLLSIEAMEKLDPEHQKVNTNRELIAQGIGNILCGLIGAIPVTAVIVRGTVNISAGAKSKYATMLHGLFILLAIFFLVQVINQIPLAALAAVLCYTGYKLVKPELFTEQHKRGASALVPFIVTIVAIVFTDLLIGVLIGLGASAFYTIKGKLSS
jgi:MFS superfamily sulfate permease-like transporter